jgi:CRISPR-associated protein Cas2
MDVLVTYDVCTDTREGERRLRRVAKICEGHGQRVQKSVFECLLNAAQLETLKHRLRKVVDMEQDSLRFYRLREPRERYLDVIGRKPTFDLREPIVV